MDDPLCFDYNTVLKMPKSPFPYIVGHEMTVVRHHPAPPPPKWHRIDLTYAAAREREHVDILTRCLRPPPRAGTQGHERLHLRITDTIRAWDGQCSQLVAVQVLSPPDSERFGGEVVTKLYDPLFFNHYQDDFVPFLCADREYSRQAAAYERLAGAGHISEYYGAYSLEIPVDGDGDRVRLVRLVRLILMQRVGGAL